MGECRAPMTIGATRDAARLKPLGLSCCLVVLLLLFVDVAAAASSANGCVCRLWRFSLSCFGSVHSVRFVDSVAALLFFAESVSLDICARHFERERF